MAYGIEADVLSASIGSGDSDASEDLDAVMRPIIDWTSGMTILYLYLCPVLSYPVRYHSILSKIYTTNAAIILVESPDEH